MNAPQTPATPDEIHHLRAILASADEALQIAMASARRGRRTDDQFMALDSLEQARTALSRWLPPPHQ